jgi:transketolase
MMPDLSSLESLAALQRYQLIELSQKAKSSHLGGALSCVDLLVALYSEVLNIDPNKPSDTNRDRLIFSKGHAISAVYVALANRGFFPIENLENYKKIGSQFPEQPAPNLVPGVEWATGSLGHGLGVAIGMALAAKIKKSPAHCYVVMSDGECQEGSIWEGAMLAPVHQLSNLTLIIDFNKWQATGRSQEIMKMDPLAEKFSAFGWKAQEIDGHNMEEILDALKSETPQHQPKAIIAHTIKGKGASFIEDDNNWHYRSPTAEEVEIAGKELGVL